MCPKCLLHGGIESQSEVDPNLTPTRASPVAGASGFAPPSIEELAGKFPQLAFLELLGKGGMGAVYKARQRGLDRLVAVKILPPEIGHDAAFAERFTREARALARLSHPHIVAVYDFGVVGQAFQPDPLIAQGQAGKPDLQGGLCYIVMEFVDGVNLRQAIQTKALTSAEALAIVPQICEALQFAHDEGIVHRDIKPENILIDKRGRVKIADFGLAKLLGTDASDHSLTATHQVMGTLRYMAPEQMQGSREVDHRADIYSLGVVFYELLTGELPMGRFAPPSKRVQVDVRLDEVVLRALEQDPEQRYQHASEVKTDVEAISASTISAVAHRRPAGPISGISAGGADRNSSRWPVPTILASLVAFLASFLPWAVETSAITAWNTEIRVVHGTVPNWIIAIAALTIASLVVIEKLHYYYSAKWLLLSLAAYGFAHTLTAAYQIGWAFKAPGLGVFLSLAAFTFVFVTKLVGEKTRTETAEKTGTGSVPSPRLVQAPADCLLLAAGIAFVTACGVALWLLASPTSSSNQFTNSMIRGNLIGMSVGLAIYSVFVAVAGLMLRRLRARLLVLLVAVIVGLFFPAVVALNVVMELRNIPVWPVVIPLWLGVPAALWAVVTLFRDDVRRAFDTAAEQRRLSDGSKPPQQTPSIASEPRLSRCALAGAIWAGLGMMALILAAFLVFPSQRSSHGPTVSSSSIDPEPAATSAEAESGGPTAPSGLLMLGFVILILVVGLSASSVFGTTICGAVAIGHIKHSDGKLYGLWLAAADVLLFPLLLLGGLIAALVARVGYSLAPHPNAAAVTSAGAFGVLVALVVCFFVGRAVWRAIVRHDKPVDQPSPASPSEKSGEPGKRGQVQ
jgi:serine/threonine protein kinase